MIEFTAISEIGFCPFKMLFEVWVFKACNPYPAAPARGMDKLAVSNENSNMQACFFFRGIKENKIPWCESLFWYGPSFFKLVFCCSRDPDACFAVGVNDKAAAVKPCIG